MKSSKEEVIRQAKKYSKSFKMLHKRPLELTQRFSDFQLAKKIETRTKKLRTQDLWRKAHDLAMKILMKEILSTKTIRKFDLRKVWHFEITDLVLFRLSNHLKSLNSPRNHSRLYSLL